MRDDVAIPSKDAINREGRGPLAVHGDVDHALVARLAAPCGWKIVASTTISDAIALKIRVDDRVNAPSSRYKARVGAKRRPSSCCCSFSTTTSRARAGSSSGLPFAYPLAAPDLTTAAADRNARSAPSSSITVPADEGPDTRADGVSVLFGA